MLQDTYLFFISEMVSSNLKLKKLIKYELGFKSFVKKLVGVAYFTAFNLLEIN